MLRYLPLLLLAFLLSACQPEEIPGGEITIKNDLLDKEYNILKIYARGRDGSFSTRIAPTEQVIIPRKEISEMRFERDYAKYTAVYEVTCPKKFNKKISINLIDIHSNRIKGGCLLNRKGKREYGSMRWE